MELFINQIELKGDSPWHQQFNYCTELFRKWQESQKDEDFEAYFQEKLRLELGTYEI